MRLLGRLTLLSLFAATGVALAVYVGNSLKPSQASDARGSPGWEEPAGAGGPLVLADDGELAEADQGVSAEPSPLQGAETQGEAEPASSPTPTTTEEPVAAASLDPPEEAAPLAPDGADAASAPPALVVPDGPVVAESHPARTLRRPSSAPRLDLSNTMRLWKSMAAPLVGQIAPDPGRLAQASTPSPPAAEPPAEAPVDPPVPAVDIQSEIRPGQGATSLRPGVVSPGQAAVKPGVVSEGDGQLHMQFPDKDIREVLDALSVYGDLSILTTPSVQGKVSATFSGTDVESALDTLLKSNGYVARRDGDFIYVGKPEDFDSLEQALDTVGTRVYRPNYVKASELQALIEPLVTPEVGVVAVSSPAEVGLASDATKAGGDAYAGGDVVVVRDYQAVLAEIDQVVGEIDVRPMQVAIEAMILSVTLDDEDTFGASFELLRDRQYIRLGWGNPIQALSDVDFSSEGLEIGFLDSSLSLFFEALERIGDTNVVATPRLMVLNKHKAEILIGEELGYVSTTMTETATSQNVEFLEVGAQLRLRPFISSDGLIRMEVHPELSTGFVETSEKFTLPNKKTTQVTTNIMVRDGCTVVIGGLMREELQASGSQVPFFGNLPVVGAAFRSRKEVLQRREILVLITPHIVYEPDTCQEGEQAACEFHRRQDVYRDKMNPLGKRHVARKYFRLAQNAWAAGDRRRALRLVELAVHFDPLNRAAIDLRSDIWMGHPVGDHTLAGPEPVPAPTTPMDGTLIDPWILDELGQAPPVQPRLRHPLDPGQPGQHVDIERPRRFP
jgi:type IV pilus assembly protein PilQ